MLDTTTVHMCDFHHPQQNFYARGKQRRSPEAEFANLFAHSYQSRFCQIHSRTTKPETLFIREVPVHGNGIADLMVLSWHDGLAPRKKASFDLTEASPTVRAFEVKLTDWRSGLMQAHRYRYFAHVAILVVPRAKLKTVEAKLNLFRTLRVGLWGFDSDSEAITRVYTPRPKRQQVAKYGDRALAASVRAASL